MEQRVTSMCGSDGDLAVDDGVVAGDLREELEVDSRRAYARPSYWARMIGGPPSAFGTNRKASPSTPRFVDSGPIASQDRPQSTVYIALRSVGD
ncbi:hypothetical protein D4764_14G0000370 [Takifugu flavidus]|uniref:Uncharacterized protein n=1 Tax=Takifugu flavidus TaxID=433684 RepID=A0A5C6P4P7_9TELE|nr:hypothetical protein D4764_14G0000370 [Takifugu flavidus]